MARSCRTLLFCVLLMLFLTSEVLQMSEARKLGENFKEGKMVNAENSGANPRQMPPSGIKEGDLDAFRPTTPGHSPGVGHSIQD